MKRIVLSILILTTIVCGETWANEVKLVTIGEGKTKELSLRNALVNAVEQAYGLYISGDTHVLNDELIRDEVVQIKRGNIKEYTVLNQAQVEDNNFATIVESTVSVDNLLKFAQSNGYECELAEKSLAANVALKKLYVRNGAKAMEQLYHTLGYIVPKMFDYRLKLGEPIIFNEDVYIPVEVGCVLNKNYETFKEIYKSSCRHILESIESTNIQGITENEHFTKMNQFNDSILNLPSKWIFGFKISDNIGGEVFAVCSKPEYFWPMEYVAPYKIYNNSGKYNEQKVGLKILSPEVIKNYLPIISLYGKIW